MEEKQNDEKLEKESRMERSLNGQPNQKVKRKKWSNIRSK